jgi:hypothetical protein
VTKRNTFDNSVSMVDKALEQPPSKPDGHIKVRDFAMTQSDTVQSVAMPRPSENAPTVPDIPVGEQHKDAPLADKANTKKIETLTSGSTKQTGNLPYSTFYSPHWTFSQNKTPPLPQDHLTCQTKVPLARALDGDGKAPRRPSETSKWSAYST